MSEERIEIARMRRAFGFPEADWGATAKEIEAETATEIEAEMEDEGEDDAPLSKPAWGGFGFPWQDGGEDKWDQTAQMLPRITKSVLAKDAAAAQAAYYVLEQQTPDWKQGPTGFHQCWGCDLAGRRVNKDGLCRACFSVLQ